MVAATGGYVPARGDIVWLQFNPRAERRPALVISPQAYNGKVGLALCCPVTRQAKGYPFEVALPDEGPVQGVVLADQVKSLDWRVRRAEKIDEAPLEILDAVLARIETLAARS